MGNTHRIIMVKVILTILALCAIDRNRVTCFQSSLFSGRCCSSRISIASDTISTQKILGSAHFPVTSLSLMANDIELEDENFIMKGLARRGLSPKITEVENVDDFLEFIGEDERLCVVKYYASWCKSCHKFGIRYKKLAMKHADMLDKTDQVSERGAVRFAEVEYGKSSSLCRSLGIRKLPYVMIHKVSVGKIAEFPCGPKYFDERLVSRLNQYLEMSDEELQFEQKMEGGTSLGHDIMSQLHDDAKQPSTSNIRKV